MDDCQKLNVILFSFDRAIQLRETLLSIDKYFVGIPYQIQVMYGVSSKLQQEGYDYLKSTIDSKISICWHLDAENRSFWKSIFPFFFKYSRNFFWYLKYPNLRKKQKDFKNQLETLILDSDTELTMFMVDDVVFYRNASIPQEILHLLQEEPENTNYKLHLGLNNNSAPEGITRNVNFTDWNYYAESMNSHWAYPFQLCSSVYNSAALYNLIHPVIYNSPNTLEGFCCFYAKQKKLLQHGYSPLIGTVYGFALNQVQNDNANINGTFDVDELCRHFIEGYTIVYKLPEKIVDINVIPDSILLTNGKNEILIESS